MAAPWSRRYHNGEAVVVWKLAPHDKLKPGDVIVFRQGGDELIKRIVYIADPGRPASSRRPASRAP